MGDIIRLSLAGTPDTKKTDSIEPEIDSSTTPSVDEAHDHLEPRIELQPALARLFPYVPVSEFEDKDLALLALEVHRLGRREQTPAQRHGGHLGAGDNVNIPVGYSFLHHFIEHDLSFTPVGNRERGGAPSGGPHRSRARMNLDSLYGGGPEDHPYLFDLHNERKFSLGDKLSQGTAACAATDVPRFNERALIGDKRNDENVILSQLHSAFLQFHNSIADHLDNEATFADIQREVRWHYQYIVLHDFLPRLCGRGVVHDILPHLRSAQSLIGARPRLRFYHWHDEPPLPVEFWCTMAGARHVSGRAGYRLNAETTILSDVRLSSLDDAISSRDPFTSELAAVALAGYREFPRDWAVDWRLFFGDVFRSATGTSCVQASSKLDFALDDPLGAEPLSLPGAPAKSGAPMRNRGGDLALGNLRVANAVGLPSGQDLARAIGVKPLLPEEIIIGRAVVDDSGRAQLGRPISEVAPNLAEQTPLWVYVLAEAGAKWRYDVARRDAIGETADAIGTRLGPVGGRIIAETIIGTLLADEASFLIKDPSWLPWATWDGDVKRNYTMVDLLRFAGAMP